MSSKPQRKKDAPNPDELPAGLASGLERARQGCFPDFTPWDEGNIPLLWELLSPRFVKDPRHRGAGDPRDVLREPLLMVSWDRTLGRWKWSISDRTLNVGWSGYLESLDAPTVQIEAQLGAGKAACKTLKVT